MVRKIDNGPALIEKWLRNKDTREFLGIWEEMYNADINAAAYEEISETACSQRNEKTERKNGKPRTTTSTSWAVSL